MPRSASGEDAEAESGDEDEQWRREVAFILAKSGNSSPEPDEEYLPNASNRGTSDDDEDKPVTQRPQQSLKALRLCKKCKTSHLRGACPVKRFGNMDMRKLYSRHLRGLAERRDALAASRAASLATHAAAAAAPLLPAPDQAPTDDEELVEETILEEGAVHLDTQRIMAEIATWNLPLETFEEIRSLIIIGGTIHHIKDSLARRLDGFLKRYGYKIGFAYDHPAAFYNWGSVYIGPPGH